MCTQRPSLHTFSFHTCTDQLTDTPSFLPSLSLSSFSLFNDEKKETYVPLLDRQNTGSFSAGGVCMHLGRTETRHLLWSARHVAAGTLLIFVRVSINGADRHLITLWNWSAQMVTRALAQPTEEGLEKNPILLDFLKWGTFTNNYFHVLCVIKMIHF